MTTNEEQIAGIKKEIDWIKRELTSNSKKIEDMPSHIQKIINESFDQHEKREMQIAELKIQPIIDTINEHKEDIHRLRNRIQSLEFFKVKVLTYSSLVSAAVGTIVAFILKMFK